MAAYDMVGQIALFAGAYTPRGWKRCDGSTLNIVEYRALFDIIGDTYGGDGLTTFALPNLGGRYMVCAQGVRPNLRPEAWSEILPPGEDSPDNGALGTGFTSGGGSGTIPTATATTQEFGIFQINYFTSATPALVISDDEGTLALYSPSGLGVFQFEDNSSTMAGEFVTLNGSSSVYVIAGDGLGAQYTADNSATIAANPRSIPDVGTVEQISGRIYRATATLNFGSTAAGQSSDLTVAVTGASVGDPVSVGLPAAPDANSCFTAWVSAADTVTVRFNNYSAGAIDPASGSYKVIVTKY